MKIRDTHTINIFQEQNFREYYSTRMIGVKRIENRRFILSSSK